MISMKPNPLTSHLRRLWIDRSTLYGSKKASSTSLQSFLSHLSIFFAIFLDPSFLTLLPQVSHPSFGLCFLRVVSAGLTLLSSRLQSDLRDTAGLLLPIKEERQEVQVAGWLSRSKVRLRDMTCELDRIPPFPKIKIQNIVTYYKLTWKIYTLIWREQMGSYSCPLPRSYVYSRLAQQQDPWKHLQCHQWKNQSQNKHWFHQYHQQSLTQFQQQQTQQRIQRNRLIQFLLIFTPLIRLMKQLTESKQQQIQSKMDKPPQHI